MKSKRQYFYNALLMTAVALLMRTVSVSFNVYVSGKVGAEAMGLLSLVGGVFGFAVTLATSGIHLATVRTVAERLGETGGAENKRCLVALFSYALFFGTLATVLLFIFSYPIGVFVLKEPRTVRALRVLSVTLLPTALGSVFNGYFTAVRRAYKNAVSQITEQAVKISTTTYLLVIVAPKTVEGSVLAIFAGGVVAECLSLILNIVLYLIDKRHYRHLKQQKYGKKLSVSRVALPVAVSAYARSGLLTIEHILIPRGLKIHGVSSGAALASYGALHSMALPVVLYPAAILSSFSALLIPEITEQSAQQNRVEIRYIAGRVYQAALLFSVGVAGVMLLLSGVIGNTLYDSKEVAYFIKMLAPLVQIMYLDTATDALLKGLGEQVYSMNVNIADAFISVICVFIFVPIMGINGYLLTIYITEIFNAALSVTRLLKISGFRPRVPRLLLRPLFCTVGATALARPLLLWLSLPARGGMLAVQILLVSFLYILLLFLTKTLRREDAKWLFTSLFASREPQNARKNAQNTNFCKFEAKDLQNLHK